MTAPRLFDVCREFGGTYTHLPPVLFRGWWMEPAVWSNSRAELGGDPRGEEFFLVQGLKAWEIEGQYFTTDQRTIRRWPGLNDLRAHLAALASGVSQAGANSGDGPSTDVLPPNPETLPNAGPWTTDDDRADPGTGPVTHPVHRVGVGLETHPPDVPYYGYCVFGSTPSPATAARWVEELSSRTAPHLRTVVRLAVLPDGESSDRPVEQAPDDETYRAILHALRAEAATGAATTYTGYRLAMTVDPHEYPTGSDLKDWFAQLPPEERLPRFFYTGFTHDYGVAEAWVREHRGKSDPQMQMIIDMAIEPITYTAVRPAHRSYPWLQVWKWSAEGE